MSRTSLKRILTNFANRFVKKSGDTMSGTLSWLGSNDKEFSVKKTLNDTNVDIGWDWDNGDGAGIAFRNADATNAGQFRLYARKNTTVERALVGDTDGSLTWDGNVIKTQGFSSPGGMYHEIWVDIYQDDAIKYDSSLTSSSSDSDWLQAYIKAICAKHPNLRMCIFKSRFDPNSAGWIEVLIYNTSDLQNGLPKYCCGSVRKWNDKIAIFHTHMYAWAYSAK